MCGIGAIVAPEAKRFEPAIGGGLAALKHRGPDDQGVYVDQECILGHRRLSIIDPACGGQPMVSASGNEIVVFNGELYDYRDQKPKYDYPFKTQSDTELILAAYSKYGDSLCRHLKGMFAFALWDRKERKLVCGRDRFGEKPLYYAFGKNGEFIAASEIKAILASGLITPHIDKHTLAAYLRMGFIPEGMGIFREIMQVLPGHTLIYTNGTIRQHPYWEVPPVSITPRSLGEIQEEFLNLFHQAVARCVVADVEVGILLSGGLDSTTIAAVASQKAKLRSFSFGMAGARNELPFARAAAAHYGLHLEESCLENLDFRELLLLLPAVYDEPLADTSCLPTLMLCKHVASQVKTTLGGDGGDELLGGYSWYQRLDEMARNVSQVTNGWTRMASAHFQNRSFCSSRDIADAGLEPWFPSLPIYLTDTIDDAMRMDIAGFLPADILKKTDRAAMHYGLELRSPFLDADLAAFLISLPPIYKIANGKDKLLLRQVFANIWPDAIRSRAKQGFGMNVADILNRHEIIELKEDLIGMGNASVFDVLPSGWVKNILEKNNKMAWAIFILSLWCQHIKTRGYWNV